MERRKVARLTSIEGVDGWKKLHLIEKRRRSRGGNVEKSRFPIFPMTINSLKADAGMGAASDVVFKLFPSTLIGNLLLKESSISLLLDAVDSALEVLTCTCCVRDSRLPLSAPTTKLETFFASSFFFRQSFHPRAHTFISISLLALSNKISLLAFLPPSEEIFSFRWTEKVSAKLLLAGFFV